VSELQKIVDAENKELDKAFDMYEKAISFEKANLSKEEDPNLIMEKGNGYLTHKRYVEAADTWKRLITKGKDSEEFYLQIGKAYYQGKDFDKADAFFNEMLLKYPDYLQGYLWSANNASAKDPDSKLGLARQKFTALISKAQRDSIKNATEIYTALHYLGYNALQAENYDQAKAFYNRMANLDPNNKEAVIKAYSSMSTLYMSVGEYSRATEFYNKILNIDPENAQAKQSIQYIQALQSSAKPKAHPNEITGVIKDSSGQPIAGASVRVKDTAAEQWTNAKGEYKFTMPEASTILVISAKDFKTKEIPVTKSRVYNATLSK
jgi:tetratricopeptide (TPR) repeat protein